MNQNKLNVFLFSENSKFFYRLNKELIQLGIRAKVLNFGSKIPNMPCIILTTIEEFKKLTNPNENVVKILSYDKNEPFEKYVTRLLAAYRIGYQENYSQIIFSIDPGTKNIGMVIFLENYYLNSHIVYTIDNLFEKVKKYIFYLQESQDFQMSIFFKVGMGVLETALEVVSNIYNYFKGVNNIFVTLIDESKTSKLRVYNKENRIPKHEISALILALRGGLEVDKQNFIKTFTDIKKQRIKLKNYIKNYPKYYDNSPEILKDLVLKMVEGELSLGETSKKLKQMTLDSLE